LQSLISLIDKAPVIFANLFEWFSAHGQSAFVDMLNENFDTILESLSGWISGGVTSALSGLVNSVFAVFSVLANLFLSIVICVYALVEKETFLAQIKKIIFAVFKPARANDILQVARYSNDMFGKFLSGKIITSAIVGVVTFLFMTIAGIPYSLLSAGVVAITNVIPYFGPFIGGIPTAFIILLTDFRRGIIYVIFLIILQQIEGNIIEPLIMEDKTGVSKFWITVALIVCGSIFGVGGMIFSVPLFAVIFYVIKMVVERNLLRKNMPVPSEAYLNAGSYDEETQQLIPAPEKEKRKNISSLIKAWIARIKDNKQKKDK
jgi:predicted PurR-regulated permease PerM